MGACATRTAIVAQRETCMECVQDILKTIDNGNHARTAGVSDGLGDGHGFFDNSKSSQLR